jgi:hypothetical protein
MCVELGKNYPAMDSGEIRIRQLGYKQELRRNFTLVSNASIGFTAISILTGITGKSAYPTPSIVGLYISSPMSEQPLASHHERIVHHDPQDSSTCTFGNA